ncbi:MAG TPA: hypothetical protein VGJ97_07440 [Anaerolineaceae bacterium]|jgi:hypothetical protein
MAARNKQAKKKAAPDLPVVPAQKGWISPKNGLTAVAIISVLLAIWEGVQVSQFRGPLESILWGLIFGATIWVIAGFAYVINRWIRRS